MKTPAAVIDKNHHSREWLIRSLLKYCPSLEIRWILEGLDEACSYWAQEEPEIVFVNPQILPSNQSKPFFEKKGLKIEFIMLLEPGEPRAYPLNYFSPSGYLYYPVDEELLILTVEHTKRILTLKNSPADSLRQRLVGIPTPYGLDFILIDDIIRCESLTSCTKVVLASSSKNVISSYNIGEFKSLLERFGFYCPHKSHLVNLSYIDKYKREGIIAMKGDDKSIIPVARNKRLEFLSLITRL